MLALVLVHTLDLAVKDRIRVNDLAGGLLQVVGKVGLVLTLDLGGGSLHGLVVHELLQLLQLGGVGLEAVTDGLLQQMGQARVGAEQPAAVGDAVRDVLECLRLVQEVIMENAVLDDLTVQLGNAVDGVAGVGADVGGADLVVADDRHIVDLALVAGESLGQVGAAAAVHLADDLPDAGQGIAEDVRIPLLQCLAHDGVVGVGKDLAADVEGSVPLIAALIQQDAHHLGDGDGGVGIVQLDGDLVGQVVQRAVLVQVVLQDVCDGRGREEVLLAQAQDLALGMVVVGVEDLGDQLGRGRLADSRVVVAGVEAAHIKAGGLSLPQTQLGNTVGAVTGDIHIVGHGDNGVVVLILDVMEAALPGLDGLAVKADLLGLIGMALDPDLTAGQPVVSSLLLPAVHDLLLEDAVLVQDGVAGAGDAVGGHAVQIAGGQAAQTAVAQASIGLLLIDGIDLDVGISQHALGNLVQAKVEQARAQAAAHEELHAEVVDLLLALAQDLGLVLLLAVRHDLAGDHGQAAVDLVSGGGVDGDVALTHQLVLEQLLKFTLCVFQNRSLLLCSHENS